MTKTLINGVEIDLASPIDVSIPLDFSGQQPSYFGVDPATSLPIVSGSFTGDTRRGASCNVEAVHLVPHCNGTHTECAGHITKERRHISDLNPIVLVPATLVTVPGPVISPTTLSEALAPADKDWLQGLLIRTNVSLTSGPYINHDKSPPSWIDSDAIRLLEACGVDHLLTDLPSIDHPESATLPGHHVFWGIDADGQPTSDLLTSRTITEMIYVPRDIPDGRYALTIAWPPFRSDAAPSRPVLYPLAD